jgi:23S rRNA (adenine2503-C2)-methyltransferase
VNDLKIVAEYGNDEVAKVYIAQMRDASDGKNSKVEFVESIQPPTPRDEKWVLIISSMFGCPVKCKMCDAGGDFGGRLTAEEMLGQVDYMVTRRYPDRRVPVSKFKVQFARMGEPALNPAVLDAMRMLPERYDAPGLNVSMSTVAPDTPATMGFFEELIAIKDRHYPNGRFQLQFSIHTTDPIKRNELIPIRKWSLPEIANYSKAFSKPENGDKKVTLNFAPASGYPIDPSVMREYFDPSRFIIKLTPLNPTIRSLEECLRSQIDPYDDATSGSIVEAFEDEGFEVILSIGELEENKIGSNCGQYIQRAQAAEKRPERSYELDRYQAAR